MAQATFDKWREVAKASAWKDFEEKAKNGKALFGHGPVRQVSRSRVRALAGFWSRRRHGQQPGGISLGRVDRVLSPACW
ncbi:MAG: hypothetical protein IPL72_00800 [Sulfuritalea sp.]|nr:hypothetical protein [Sulfuritalea sp.]